MGDGQPLTAQPKAGPGAPLAPGPVFARTSGRRRGAGLKVTCECRWAENPHRVGLIDLEVEAPGLSEEKREAFERMIDHGTVHNSFLPPPMARIVVAATWTFA